MDMRNHIKERADLAHTYACDGAYSRAAQILEELAQTVRAHHDAVTQEIGPRPLVEGQARTCRDD